jgi:hypothetical protein
LYKIGPLNFINFTAFIDEVVRRTMEEIIFSPSFQSNLIFKDAKVSILRGVGESGVTDMSGVRL